MSEGERITVGERERGKSSSNLAWRLDGSEFSRETTRIHLVGLLQKAVANLRRFRLRLGHVWSQRNEEAAAASRWPSPKRKNHRKRKTHFCNGGGFFFFFIPSTLLKNHTVGQVGQFFVPRLFGIVVAIRRCRLFGPPVNISGNKEETQNLCKLSASDFWN